MSDASSRRGESRYVGRVLDALGEETNRTILSALDEPTPVAELVEECEIPMSTVYRRLDTLSDLGLVAEHVSIDGDRGRYRRYERDVSRVSISVDEGGRLTVRVERPADGSGREATWRPTES